MHSRISIRGFVRPSVCRSICLKRFWESSAWTSLMSMLCQTCFLLLFENILLLFENRLLLCVLRDSIKKQHFYFSFYHTFPSSKIATTKTVIKIFKNAFECHQVQLSSSFRLGVMMIYMRCIRISVCKMGQKITTGARAHMARRKQK